jgi:hypothetical protein
MVMAFPREVIASQCRCMPKCMSFSTLLACLHRSRSSFKARTDDNCGMKHEGQIQQEQRGIFHGLQGDVPKPPKRKRSRRSPSKKSSARKGGGADRDGTVSEDGCCGRMELTKGWDLRRRDSKVNGADIYVARVTKRGLGNAKPCWRCLQWCYWAGIKRIFHWDEAMGGWEVVKVNCPGTDQYETTADIRLFTGTVSRFS